MRPHVVFSLLVSPIENLRFRFLLAEPLSLGGTRSPCIQLRDDDSWTPGLQVTYRHGVTVMLLLVLADWLADKLVGVKVEGV